MVAAAEVAKSRQCTAVEAYFARLVACEGMLPSRAYRVAWKTDAKRAHELGGRVMSRPWVAAKVAELQARAESEGLLALNERRRMLATIARTPVTAFVGKDLTSRSQLLKLGDRVLALKSVRTNSEGTHVETWDRLATLKLDAELAGEYRQEIGVGGEITVAHVLRALGGEDNVVPIAATLADVVSEPARALLPQSDAAGDAAAPLTLGSEQNAPASQGMGADAVLDGPLPLAPGAWLAEE